MAPGDRSLAIGEVTRTDFVKFAGAGGDFNPMHHDDEFARRSGFPSVFAMGMMTASMASKFLTDWFGVENVRSYDVRFRAMVWPGEVLTASGRKTDPVSIDGEDRTVVEFEVTNADGEVKIACRAEVVTAGDQS